MVSRAERISEYIRQKKWFFLALALTLITARVILSYISMTQTPIAGVDLSPAKELEVWRFSLKDGTELWPDQAGVFRLPDADTVVYCTRSLKEHEDLLTVSAMLAVNSRACDVAVFADGELVADPSHRFAEDEDRFAEPKSRSSAGGLLTLGRTGELTLAIRFLTENASVAALPSIELFYDGPGYYSQWISVAAESALPAGVFLAAALFLAGLFLFQLYLGRANGGFLLLSLLALSFCLLRTVSYGVLVIWQLQTPVITWFLQIMPALMILWLLWYHTAGMIRRFGWMLPLLCSCGALLGVFLRLYDNAGGARWTNLLQGKLLPLIMLSALVLCAWEVRKGNAYYRKFFLFGGYLSVFAVVITVLSFFQNGAWWHGIITMSQNVLMLQSFFQPMQLLNHLLLLLFFLLAIYDFILDIVRRNNEMQALALQNRYAAEHAAYLSRSLDETLALRHEFRHHIEALKALSAEGDLSRISYYVEQMGGKMLDAPNRYTDHAIINALISSGAARARELGAGFEAIVQTPAQMDIDDTDIAVLLSNMIDNALEAVSAIPDHSARSLSVKVEIFEETGLFLSCTNSFTGGLKRDEHGELLSSKTDAGHGMGIKAMRHVAEKYNSVLLVSEEDGSFTVKTYLYFKKEELSA